MYEVCNFCTVYYHLWNENNVKQLERGIANDSRGLCSIIQVLLNFITLENHDFAAFAGLCSIKILQH